MCNMGNIYYSCKAHQSLKKSYSQEVSKKGQEIFSYMFDRYIYSNNFVGVIKLILIDKSCRCWLKIGGNFLTNV